jgi:uncharacterized protein (TIGR02421 family)
LRFKISTERGKPPLNILEATENALLDIEFNRNFPQLTLDYGASPHPDNMQALDVCKQHSRSNWFWMGVGISPVFRQDNKILPFELTILKGGFTRALRRILYAFINEYTSHTPKHYHELGKHSISTAVLQTDKALAQIKDKFDLLFHVTPVNVQEVWSTFSDSQFLHLPDFTYRPRPIDPDLLKRDLYAIKIEQIDDPALAHIFQSQREEISRLLTMIADRNSPNFMYESLQVFGGVNDELLVAAKSILNGVSAKSTSGKGQTLSATELATRARVLIDEYQQQHANFNYAVEIRNDLPGVMVSRGKLLIGSSLRASSQRVDATLAHEVSTHIVTHFNGCTQPFQQFHSGMQDYEATQEGLAVLAEYFVGNLQSGRLRTIAGRVIAVDALVRGADFRQVFNLLNKDWDFSSEQAFQISMRVFRGGGFTKDTVYLRGLLDVLEYVKNDGDYMLLFVGKIGLQHLPFVQELRWRKLLKVAQVKPNYLGFKDFDNRMALLKRSASLLDLVNGEK